MTKKFNLKNIGLIFLFILCSEINASIIRTIPKSSGALFILNSRLKQYLTLLREKTQISDLNNGCLRLIEKKLRSPQDSKTFILCAESIQRSENEIYERLQILKDGVSLISFVFIQKGIEIKPSPLESILDLSFRIKGESGHFIVDGLVEYSFHYKKREMMESFQFSYDPIDFNLIMFYVKDETYERIKFERDCSFCDGLDWIEVREIKRDNLPLDIRYYHAEDSNDITPKTFNQKLGNFFYRSLGQLGRKAQTSLVEEGGFPKINF